MEWRIIWIRQKMDNFQKHGRYKGSCYAYVAVSSPNWKLRPVWVYRSSKASTLYKIILQAPKEFYEGFLSMKTVTICFA